MRPVTLLTNSEKQQLQRLVDNSLNHWERQKAQVVLLSSRGYKEHHLAEITNENSETIRCWLAHWDKEKFESLKIEPCNDPYQMQLERNAYQG